MTNKVEKPRPGRAPQDEPPPANSLVRKSNSEGHRDEEPSVAADETQVRPSDDAPPPRRRLKGKADEPMNNSSADLQTRHDVIGAGLKRIFDEVVAEPIPPEFLALLDQIDLKQEP